MKALNSIPTLMVVISVDVPKMEEIHNVWVSLDIC